jgi:hypothetical protein
MNKTSPWKNIALFLAWIVVAELWTFAFFKVAEYRAHGSIHSMLPLYYQYWSLQNGIASLIVATLDATFRAGLVARPARFAALGALSLAFFVVPLFLPYSYVDIGSPLDVNPTAVGRLYEGVFLLGLVVEVGIAYLLTICIKRRGRSGSPVSASNS